mgnify:CR=1 FL=1
MLAATAIQATRAADLPGNTLFALDLYRQLAGEDPQANLFFSPYSISTALAMTYTGAHGQTATEMAATLHFDKPQAEVPAAFAALPDGAAATDREWRVHFHVPIFLDRIEPFESTQAFVREVLAMQRAQPVSAHLEVETYTWDVLPAPLRSGSVDVAIARELDWVRHELTA